MKYLLEIGLPEYLGIEDELDNALEEAGARHELEIHIREWVWEFLDTVNIPYGAIEVTVENLPSEAA